MNLPKARTSDILEQEADKELLVYDLRINKAYNLNETLKTVYKACDGITSFDALKHKYSENIIYLSLDELRKNNLLEGDYNSPFVGMTRREVVRRVGLAATVALPVISSLIAPSAARAASGALLANGQACNAGSQCQNGICAGSACCSGFYTGNIPCSTQSDCCFGGNGVIFCGTNAVGATNVCCSTNVCSKTADCCAGEVCVISGGIGSCR